MSTDPWRKPPSRPYKPRDPKVTSAVMSAVRSKGNKAEVALRKELWRRGYRYRLYDGRLPGRPDLVFRSRKAVVFVDGDFWHGRALIEQGSEALLTAVRTERGEWWLNKITRTVERDRLASERLRSDGWKVLRLWESEVKRDVAAAADRVEEFLTQSRPEQREDQPPP
jgi:DNA mismatch endonuclease (patch repair protein)